MPNFPIEQHGILKFSKWATEQGAFTYGEMLDYLKTIDMYGFRTAISTMVAEFKVGSDENMRQLRALTPEALFGYLQWVELERALQAAAEARKESDDAKRLATLSFWVAIASMVVSTIFSVWQILKC